MDKKKIKKSKEEIAREFVLPERKSKIESIMKPSEVYCICRSSDCSRFMIGCDGCEEWYHGDCINVTEKEAKHIKSYFCQKCRAEDPSLQTVFRLAPAEKASAAGGGGAQASSSSNQTSDVEKKQKKTKESRESSNAHRQHVNRCGVCEGCRAPNCNNCHACRIRVGHKPRCERRTCVVQWQYEQEQQGPASNAVSQNSRHKKKGKPAEKRGRKRRRSLTPEVFINPELEGIRQCYGPGCRKNARPQSKYCSEQCGINLATNRIFQVLPQRIQEWNLSSCRAEEENKKQLDQIRAKQAVVQLALGELDKRHEELDMIVERAKHSTLDPNRPQDNSDIEDEQSMYCITCGHEIHSRTAIKHMEKCFNKYESQASFGSIHKTRTEGHQIFCDFFNPASKTYCKRLRVLCPEHSKDPKISDNDVCGCPLVANVFQPTGEFCRAPKKSCFKHFVWEKIRRAEIDLERVRQWIKMDELLEQERHIRHNMASRAGVLALMLHSTYNHEVMEEILRQQQQQMAAAQKQKEILEKKQEQLKKMYEQQQQKKQSKQQVLNQNLQRQQVIVVQQQQKQLLQQQQSFANTVTLQQQQLSPQKLQKIHFEKQQSVQISQEQEIIYQIQQQQQQQQQQFQQTQFLQQTQSQQKHHLQQPMQQQQQQQPMQHQQVTLQQQQQQQSSFQQHFEQQYLQKLQQQQRSQRQAQQQQQLF